MLLIADGRGVLRGCEDVGICREVFYTALREYKPLADSYARAREQEADKDADDVKSIADDDELAPDEKRVRIDARKWSAAVRRPKLYGPKLEVTEVADPLTPAGKISQAKELIGRIDRLKSLLEIP
jgi:hypothetical protein